MCSLSGGFSFSFSFVPATVRTRTQLLSSCLSQPQHGNTQPLQSLSLSLSLSLCTHAFSLSLSSSFSLYAAPFSSFSSLRISDGSFISTSPSSSSLPCNLPYIYNLFLFLGFPKSLFNKYPKHGRPLSLYTHIKLHHRSIFISLLQAPVSTVISTDSGFWLIGLEGC